MIRRIETGRRAGGGPVEYMEKACRIPLVGWEERSAFERFVMRLYPGIAVALLLETPTPDTYVRAIAQHAPPDPARARLLPGLRHLSRTWRAPENIPPCPLQDIIDWALATRPNLFAMTAAEACRAATAWHATLVMKVNATAIRKALPAHPPKIETPYGTWHLFSAKEEDLPALRTFGLALGHCYQRADYAEQYGLETYHWTLIKDGHLLAAVTWNMRGRLLDMKGPQNKTILLNSPAGNALPWLALFDDFAPYFDYSPLFPPAVLLWTRAVGIDGCWIPTLHRGFQGPVHTDKRDVVLTPETAEGATHLCIRSDYLVGLPMDWAARALTHFTHRVSRRTTLHPLDRPQATTVRAGPVDFEVWFDLVALTGDERAVLRGWLERRSRERDLRGILGYTGPELELLHTCRQWGDAKAAGDEVRAADRLRVIQNWERQ